MLLSAKSVAVCCSATRIVIASGMALAGAMILLPPTGTVPARAAETLAFTIPADEGYGIADCMASGSECGRAIATSWCEAHGHAHAAAFGMADDVTGSTGAGHGPEADAGAVVIRCDD